MKLRIPGNRRNSVTHLLQPESCSFFETRVTHARFRTLHTPPSNQADVQFGSALYR